MRKTIASISIILVFTILCGCSGLSRPEGFQDVQNIVSVDYQFADSQTSDDHYSFDLERGVFRFTRDADRNSPEYELEQSDEYELKQSDIESIRSAFEPAENWAQHYKYSYFSTAMTQYISYKIDIEYSDGTHCILEGTAMSPGDWKSSNTKWPKGFEELKILLDGIVSQAV